MASIDDSDRYLHLSDLPMPEEPPTKPDLVEGLRCPACRGGEKSCPTCRDTKTVNRATYEAWCERDGAPKGIP